MEATDNESQLDDPFQLLERFVEWWINNQQEEIDRLGIKEINAQLDRDLNEARNCSDGARRHQRTIKELEACLTKIEEAKCLVFLEENTLYYLLNEIERSLKFEGVITYKKVVEGRLTFPWKFFGVNALKTLKREVQSLVA